MMTKKHALDWRKKTEMGERPLVPKELTYLLGTPAHEIKVDIRHAKVFDYGTTCKTYSRRLVQMGLLDDDLNLTSLGQEYLTSVS